LPVTGQAPPGAPRIPLAVRYLDLIVLALALPLFLVAGLPMLGYAVGAGAWLVQRVIQTLLNRRAEATDDVRTRVGLLTASMIGRGWLCALAIFGIGMYDEDAGLAAAILVVALFTIYFTVGMILRPMTQPLPPREVA
jgi:hypothetical protein